MKQKIFTLLFAVLAFMGTKAAPLAVVNGTCGDSLTWSLNSKDSTLTIEGSGEMTSAPWSEYKLYVAYITLPADLTKILESAFSGCSNAKQLKVLSLVPPTGGANSGINAPSCKLIVPQGSIEQYANAIWWEDFGSIEEYIPIVLADYTVTTYATNGMVTGAGIYQEGSTVQIEAIPNEDYYFTCWQDSVTSNPREFVITQDTTFRAYFDTDVTYTLTVNVNDKDAGYVTGEGTYKKNSRVSIRAYANVGYKFIQWSDSVTSVSRSILMDKDQSYTAEFAPIPAGESLSWSFDEGSGTLTIRGTGSMDNWSSEKNVPWYNNNVSPKGFLPIKHVVIEEGVTSIGDYAFRNCSTIVSFSLPTTLTSIGQYALRRTNITSLTIPANVTTIGRCALYDCDYLSQVTCLATIPPSNESGSRFFETIQSISITVPCGAKQAYNSSKLWNYWNIVEQEPEYSYTYSISIDDDKHGYVSTQKNCNSITIQAIPSDGYAFAQWSDGNKENPLTIVLTQDTTLIAEFDTAYYVNVYTNGNGNVNGGGSYVYNSEVTISATPNTGYHFTQWSDGNTENPRTIILTENINLSANFAIDVYNVQIVSEDEEKGTVTCENGHYEYNSYVDFSATPKPGYIFVAWSDGNTSSSRSQRVRSDITLTASFTPGYTIYETYSEGGYISGAGSYEISTNPILTAYPYDGFYFSQWSDGNSENPRTVTLTQDTTFTAEFLPYRTGICGDSLTWTYNPETATLTISGKGALTSNYNYGAEAPQYMQTLVIEEGVTVIGRSAFEYRYHIYSPDFYKIILPKGITSFESDAFYGCSNLSEVHYAGTISDFCQISFGGTCATPLHYAKTLYLGKQQVTEIEIPDSIAQISNYAFYGCQALTNIRMNITTETGYQTFTNCTAKIDVYGCVGGVCGENLNWTLCAEDSTLRITGSGETYSYSYDSAPWYAYRGFVKNIELPAKITKIGTYAFVDLNAIQTLTYAGSVAEWCAISFENSLSNPLQFAHKFVVNGEEMHNLIIPSTIDSVSDYAFYNVYALDTIVMDISTTSAYQNTFLYMQSALVLQGCNPVTDLYEGAQWKICNGELSFINATYIPSYSYQSAPWDAYAKGINKVILDGISSIGDNALYQCNLREIQCMNDFVPQVLYNSSLPYDLSKIQLETTCATAKDYAVASYWSEMQNIAKEDITILIQPVDERLGSIEIIKPYSCVSGYMTVRAHTNRAVRFDGWDNGASTSLYTFYPTTDTTITALMVVDSTQFIVNATADATKGTVRGSGTYYYGEEIVLLAIPNENYAFRGWSDGVYSNPRHLPLGNYDIEAIFGDSKQLNSEGTDFWVTFLRSDWENPSNLTTLSLTFAALEPCVVTIENPANGMREDIAMPAGVTRNLQLFQGTAAYYKRSQNAWDCYTDQTDSIQSTALHITSTKNISVFAANHKLKTFDATNVLPTSDLRDEYYIQTYPVSDHSGYPQGSHFAIVATQDSTIVDYTLTTRAQSLYASEAGIQHSTPILNAGEVYYIWTGKNDGYESDLSGSHVKARDRKPIAVFQGAPHTNIPYKVRDRDHLYSQAVPIVAWGNEFVVPSSLHHKRDIIRVMALEDGTEVYVNGVLVHTFDFINGDDNDRKRTFEFELGEEYVNSYAKGVLPSPLVADSSCYITTSAPSSVHLFMTSNQYDNDRNSYKESINDPAMLYINPIEQMVKEACFSTYNTVPLHYINIIARTGAINDIVLKGQNVMRNLANNFRPVTQKPDYSYARIQIENGVYTLSGSQGFIAYVYGFGEKESYAFSVGGKSVYTVPKMKLIVECDSTMGYTIGSGDYDFNEIVTIEAHAWQGYEFVHWSDGATDSVRQITVTGDKEIFALFKAEEVVPTDTIVVTPSDISADIHWPEIPNAYYYCITVWLDAFHTRFYCKLYFNAYGLLINIVFNTDSAPNRAGAPRRIAESNVEFDFSVYGLSPETTYYFTVTAYDEEGTELGSIEGKFTTLDENEATGIHQITDDQSPVTNKIIKDNHLFILRGDKTYTVTGQEVK